MGIYLGRTDKGRGKMDRIDRMLVAIALGALALLVVRLEIQVKWQKEQITIIKEQIEKVEKNVQNT
jgi:hypothetical protein